jgi:isopentenyl-diphosphate delta-isomerase
MSAEDQVILIDEADKQIGVANKLEAHQLGKLHRALSVFVFNSRGELLLQKRARAKYHSGGLWSNTCCSHPRPGEDTLAAARRRLKEEMGLECDLKEVHRFTYKATFENGLTEHEYDRVFVGTSDNEPTLNQEEAEDWKWIDPRLLAEEMKAHPGDFTYWFRVSLEDVLKAAQLAGTGGRMVI